MLDEILSAVNWMTASFLKDLRKWFF